MPGVAVQRLAESLERLLTLPEGHTYRAVADRSYRPKRASNEEQWQQAFPLYAEILAADPRALTDHWRLLTTRRAALARHVYWLAGDAPNRLNPDHALDDTTIERSALLSEGHTNRRSQLSFMAQLRSFRGGFPDLFLPKTPAGPQTELGPLSDRDFDIALSAADTFRNPQTRNHVRALLLLGRGAGADGADCRFIAGTDVHWRPGAGLWVNMTRPKHERQVPVLVRYQAELADLARSAGGGALIGGGVPPAEFGRSNELNDLLKRRLRPQHPGLELSTARLRKAWKLELLGSWRDLHVFLSAAGLRSMHGLEDLMRRCPAPPADPVYNARLLGGLAELEPYAVDRPSRSGDHP